MLRSKFGFRKGLKDGLPIAIGYISVSFAYGILAVSRGLPVWAPILISATNLTGTGQFVGTDMLLANASLLEIAFTMLIINARYILMSIGLSQRLSPTINIGQRMVIAFGNTDEIFAVAMSKGELLNMSYLMGLILGSYCGWIGGTTLGAVFGGILPQSLLSAMGIALFAMYIAIIVPPMRGSKAVVFVVFIAIVMSLILRFTPYLNKIPPYIVIIVVGIAAAIVGSLVFPLKDDSEHEPPPYASDTSVVANGNITNIGNDNSPPNSSDKEEDNSPSKGSDAQNDVSDNEEDNSISKGSEDDINITAKDSDNVNNSPNEEEGSLSVGGNHDDK